MALTIATNAFANYKGRPQMESLQLDVQIGKEEGGLRNRTIPSHLNCHYRSVESGISLIRSDELQLELAPRGKFEKRKLRTLRLI